MAVCLSCASHIPDGQKFCSMCYGDPAYGKDGYYQDWLDRQEVEQNEDESRGEE